MEPLDLNDPNLVKAIWKPEVYFPNAKGQLISKADCQVVNCSKKRTNEFVFTTMRRVFIRFLEEIVDTKKTFRNYLTFKDAKFQYVTVPNVLVRIDPGGQILYMLRFVILNLLL
jgi:hypothetical protein